MKMDTNTVNKITGAGGKNLDDRQYVEAVLAGRVASCVPDGELEPPLGARCRTRSGFRAWLRKAKRR